ncbi:hypothetical protein HanRHA438_Chr01g0029611 [Helianthus annuus]|nr:hypothetical protein HanHA300_Chr01g0023501 [Helianthus annuus]KAJ0627468.1 hypothetical protein HanHA89_Chr01g0025701 [Helianthus annuus]KAJ0809842.1 hypothetical protein HanPI659440_Chr01g0019891 [Helianthus annuus]KAJ0948647.1 hypothetical protein HanRHA438_Chr01g0029611 [Helianthus annuus]KAJ0957518.1 hypothetical protein HanPSC8_Chr01g0028221 [Helianthus annuus]
MHHLRPFRIPYPFHLPTIEPRYSFQLETTLSPFSCVLPFVLQAVGCWKRDRFRSRPWGRNSINRVLGFGLLAVVRFKDYKQSTMVSRSAI